MRYDVYWLCAALNVMDLFKGCTNIKSSIEGSVSSLSNWGLARSVSNGKNFKACILEVLNGVLLNGW